MFGKKSPVRSERGSTLMASLTRCISLAMALSFVGTGLPVLAQGEGVESPLDRAADAPMQVRDEEKILQPFAEGSTVTKVIVTLRPPTGKRQPTRWDDPVAARAFRSANRAASRRVVDRLPRGEAKVRQTFENLAGFSCEVTSSALAVLLSDPEVATVEPVRTFQPYSDKQSLELMKATEIRKTYSGQGVAVAIVDTGVDYTHPKLGGTATFPNSVVIGGYDFIETDPDPYPNEGEAHGTLCAGIVAGGAGDEGDYAGGIAPGAKIYALKVGGAAEFSADAILAAWDWCLTHKNDDPNNPLLIVSNSFGISISHPSPCDELWATDAQMVNLLVQNDISLFMASGNDGFCSGIGEPACLSKVISVGATYDADHGLLAEAYPYSEPLEGTCDVHPYDGSASGYIWGHSYTWADRVTYFSNVGENLALLAPGFGIVSPDIRGAGGNEPGDYATWAGTSASCPFAAGAGAIVQSAAKSILGRFLTPDELKLVLRLGGDPTAVDRGPAGTVPRVNVEGAVQMLPYFFPNARVFGTNHLLHKLGILNGDQTPSVHDGTEFGRVAVGSGFVRTYKITNSRLHPEILNDPVVVRDVTISGDNPEDFAVVAPRRSLIVPTSDMPELIVIDNGTTYTVPKGGNIRILFNPTTAGTRSAVVTVYTNDREQESVYSFKVQGTGVTGSPNPAKEQASNEGPMDGAVVTRSIPATESVAYNLIYADQDTRLTGISAGLVSDGAASVSFQVYKYQESGFAAQVAGTDAVKIGPGTQNVESPELGVDLKAGSLYAVGLHWKGSATLTTSGVGAASPGIRIVGSAMGEGRSLEAATVAPEGKLPITPLGN